MKVSKDDVVKQVDTQIAMIGWLWHEIKINNKTENLECLVARLNLAGGLANCIRVINSSPRKDESEIIRKKAASSGK